MPTRPDHLGSEPRIERHFDGILCFGGEDWWYHNRGHFDMRMMREISAYCPVIYVNSIGMRVPSPREGGVFVGRVRRKIQSLRRGFGPVDDRFVVGSLCSLPGRVGRRVSRGIAVRQLDAALHRYRIRRPLVWVACPTAATLLDDLPSAGLVYQRTDEYECFPGVNASQIRSYDQALKQAADLTVFCASDLADREGAECARSLYVEHGVDFERFAAAGAGLANEPDDLANVPRPRVGFVGGIDAHTFDVRLFEEVTERLPWVHFVLVGSCSIPGSWSERPNVHLVGQRPYDQVADYMAANDVLIMPWCANEWIKSCNPVKLKEYLAIGRPIVSTPFPQLSRFGDLVRTASDGASFADEIRDALQSPGYSMRRRARVAGETWTVAAQSVMTALWNGGIVPDIRATPEPFKREEPVRSITHPQIRARRRADKLPPLGQQIRRCFLLAGGVAEHDIETDTRRAVLDQVVFEGQRVLDVWLRAFGTIREVDRYDTSIRVLHGSLVAAPWPAHTTQQRIHLERDARPYRGSIGSVADASRDLCDDDVILVVDGTHLPVTSLQPVIDTHFESDAEITLGMNQDGSAAGVYVIRVSALGHVPPRGYCDLKEQWLARVAQAGVRLEVQAMQAPGCLRVRTHDELMRATRAIVAQRATAGAAGQRRNRGVRSA